MVLPMSYTHWSECSFLESLVHLIKNNATDTTASTPATAACELYVIAKLHTHCGISKYVLT